MINADVLSLSPERVIRGIVSPRDVGPRLPLGSLASLSAKPLPSAPVDIVVLNASHRRREEFCQKIAALSAYYAQHHDFILPQSVQSLLAASEQGHILVAVSKDEKKDFVGAVQLKPLYPSSHLGLSHHGMRTDTVFELGTLLKDRATTLSHIGFHLTRACLSWAEAEQALVIATSRNVKTSGAALRLGGFHEVQWEHLSALSALTCDPGCQSTSEGSAWTGCGNSVECHAMKSAARHHQRSDACSLYVSDASFAYELNSRLEFEHASRENGVFSARAFRVQLGLSL